MNSPKEKDPLEPNNETKKKETIHKIGIKPSVFKKQDIFENLITKSNSLQTQTPKMTEILPAKSKKTINLKQKNNYLAEKEALCLSNDFQTLTKRGYDPQITNKRATKSKSPFGKMENHINEKLLPPMAHHIKNNKSQMGISKKNENCDKIEEKHHEKKYETIWVKKEEKHWEKKQEKHLEKNLEKKVEKKKAEEKKDSLNDKYNHAKFKSKRSKSSLTFEHIEEDIDNNMNESQEKNNSFLAKLTNQGVLEIKGFNVEDDFIQKQVDIIEILDAKQIFDSRETEIREENSLFDKEMNKFLESTFQRQETPPLGKRKIKINDKNDENFKAEGKVLKNGIVYDPILDQYYDKEMKEYFELI